MRSMILATAMVLAARTAGAETIDHGTDLVVLGWIDAVHAVELDPCPEEGGVDADAAPPRCGTILQADVRPTEFLRGRRRETLSVRFPRLPEERELAGTHAALFLERHGDELWVAEGRAGLVTSRDAFVATGVNRLRLALALEPSRASDPVPVDDAPVMVNPNGGVSLPVAVKKIKPDYPVIARTVGARGKVILNAVIGTDGRVSDLRVLKSPFPGWGLELAAIQAVSQWQYQPALKEGRPVTVYMTVAVDFSLDGMPPAGDDDQEPPPPGPLAVGAHGIQDALAEMVPQPLDPGAEQPPVLETEERALRWTYARWSKALRENDVKTYTGLIHPEWLERFRAMVLEWASEERAAGGLQNIFGTSDRHSLEEMSAADMWEKLGGKIGDAALYTGRSGQIDEFLGAVAQGDDLRHVTVRSRSKDGRLDRVEILTFKRDGTSWKVVPDGGPGPGPQAAFGDEDD